MREKHYLGLKSLVETGITPASAGKTNREVQAGQVMRDHPRECGKNSTVILLCSGSMGSPPRVREKLALLALCRLICRITPASAGKTSSSSARK